MINSQIPEILNFDENVDIGIILEQNWMLYEIAQRFCGGRLFYVFSIDRNVYKVREKEKTYAFLQAHGASIIACYAEELIKRKANTIYRIGTCGSLQRNIDIGDIVLSLAAIRDEGTSNQYIPPYFPSIADINILIEIERNLKKSGLTVHTGITWTTDGRFVESNEKIKLFSEFGVKSVDMETSALYIVCYLHRIPSLSISVVTDTPINDLDKEFKGEIPDMERNRLLLSERLYTIISAILGEKYVSEFYGKSLS